MTKGEMTGKRSPSCHILGHAEHDRDRQDDSRQIMSEEHNPDMAEYPSMP